jgi:haloalkane dehalogenase
VREIFQKLISGAKGQQHTTIINSGKFLQEDQSEKSAEILLQFMSDNPND